MRRPIVPCACLLALITGAWFGQAHTLFQPLEPIGAADTPSQRVADTAWRFYDAIDLLLRTGDDAALRDVVSPDFVDHTDEPDAVSGRDGLVRALASLRATHPELRLVPTEMVAQGDRAVARVGLSGGTEGHIIGIPLAGSSPWPRVDTVRVRGGQIVERWGDPGGHSLAATLFIETLKPPHQGELVPGLRRISFSPGAGDRSTGFTGPAIAFVETGGVEVGTVADLSEHAPAKRGTQDATPVVPGEVRALGPGDTHVVPEGSAIAVRNRTDAQAVILLITLAQPTAIPVRGTAAEAVVPDVDAGVTVQVMAVSTVTVPNPGAIRAAMALVTLSPGTRLATHEVAGVEIIAVTSGTLTATVDGAAFSVRLRSPNGRSAFPGSFAQVAEGFGLAVSGEDATTSYRNETDRPVTLLLLTLAPE